MRVIVGEDQDRRTRLGVADEKCGLLRCVVGGRCYHQEEGDSRTLWLWASVLGRHLGVVPDAVGSLARLVVHEACEALAVLHARPQGLGEEADRTRHRAACQERRRREWLRRERTRWWQHC